jgi:hypothetical protein
MTTDAVTGYRWMITDAATGDRRKDDRSCDCQRDG